MTDIFLLGFKRYWYWSTGYCPVLAGIGWYWVLYRYFFWLWYPIPIPVSEF